MPSITQTPATFTSDPSAGTAAWATPTGALASDDSYAVASVEGLGSSQRLRGVGPAFAGIPAGSAIVGIEVLVEATADTSGGAVFEFAEVSLVVAGSVAGSNRGGAAMQDGGDSDPVYAFGGASDLWGLTPTLAQVQAADFGCVVRVAETSGGTELATVSIDHVEMRVYYAQPSGVSRTAISLGIGIGL